MRSKSSRDAPNAFSWTAGKTFIRNFETVFLASANHFRSPLLITPDKFTSAERLMGSLSNFRVVSRSAKSHCHALLGGFMCTPLVAAHSDTWLRESCSNVLPCLGLFASVGGMSSTYVEIFAYSFSSLLV